jgi:hypothetical protein
MSSNMQEFIFMIHMFWLFISVWILLITTYWLLINAQNKRWHTLTNFICDDESWKRQWLYSLVYAIFSIFMMWVISSL